RPVAPLRPDVGLPIYGPANARGHADPVRDRLRPRHPRRRHARHGPAVPPAQDAGARMTTAAAVPPVLPPLLDLAGTAVFALSGALVAARLKQTFVTMAFFALLTGVGGGSVRDVLIGVPAFWLRDPWVAAMILAIALMA